MRPLNLNLHSLATATLLLCPLFARHAAAAPPPPTTLAIPTAPPAEPAGLAPPSEPHLQLAKPTTATSLDFKPQVDNPQHDLDLRDVTVTVAAAPGITPAPAGPFDADTSGGEWWHTGVDGNGDTFRYRQTTYYSCVTQGQKEHCGWHRPILEVSGAGGLGEPQAFGGVGGRAVVVGLVAGGFAYLMGR